MSSHSQKEPNARSRRAARACARCHSRKVRCDGSITGFPCTNCRLDARTCTLHSGKRDKEKQMLKAIAKERDTNPYPTPSTSELHPDPPNVTFIRSQMALKVPVQEVLDVFTKHYFLYVHPCLPVVDEAVFWRKYRSVDASAGKISTFLFQAMLFAASSFVPIEAAKECGYDSLISARDDLYRRAKRLYEGGVEKDRLVISQACLLLTYYTTDAERSTNSRWLRLAIRHAKKERAHLYHHLPQTGLGSGRKSSDLKRLWWSCMIRDRIISLGMRRPLQITPDQFDLHQMGLSFQDLEEECLQSEVYTPDTKIALCRVLASLCHLIVAVTDIIMLVYPAAQGMPFSLADRRAQLNRLEETKFALLDWELSWVANPDGKEYYIHPSLTLYTNLCAIYFQSARIALCNRICLLIGCSTYLSDETDVSRIEFCRAELATAIRSTADNVKQLILNGVADKLPISAVAYTLLPQILLSIQTQLSTSSEDKQIHEVMLVFFTEVSRFLRSQYYMRLILAVSWKALELCRPSTPLLKSSDTSIDRNASRNNELILKQPFFTDLNTNSLYYFPGLFQLKLTEYIRLLRYVDEFMSLRRTPGEDVIYPSPTPAAVQGQTRTNTHGRTISQTSVSSSTSSALRRAVTATASTVDLPRDTSTVYPGDGEEADESTSRRWIEDYFWLYFGEKELEGNAPQTNIATTHSSSGDGKPGHDDRSGVVAVAGSGGSPPYGSEYEFGSGLQEIKGKGKESENSSQDRATSFQNMLDCLPLLGE
ncbi:fungal-specific transcription factor domain-containing protein [Aspergillus aurantiobrunneus]